MSDQEIILAFKVAIICYLAELVWVVWNRKKKSRRMEIAECNQWIVKAHSVKSKIANTAKYEDYKNNKTRTLYICHYEYEIDGVKKRIKMESGRPLPYEKEFYYDAEHGNKILNSENNNFMKVTMLLPIAVFWGVLMLI